MSLRFFGLPAFRQAIDRCLDLAIYAQSQIEAHPQLELMSPASLGIVTFRRHPHGEDDERVLERMNADLADQIERGGELFISTGRIRGRYALRLCVLNHSTSQADVDRALELAATLEVDLGAPADGPVHISYPEIAAGWLRRPTLDVDGLRSLPLFASLADELCEDVLLSAHEHLAVPGEPIVEQWQATRDLYVVMTGKVQVVAELETPVFFQPGDFFGELAAIDWGAGFGRTRTATVVATQATRLLVLESTLVNELMKADPAFAQLLEHAARERLAERRRRSTQ